jgi:hypothetical protein
LTYKPTATTLKAIEKEVQREAALFEERCKQGQKVTANVKFETFAEQWLEEVAPSKLKVKTLDNYRNYAKIVYKAIGL